MKQHVLLVIGAAAIALPGRYSAPRLNPYLEDIPKHKSGWLKRVAAALESYSIFTDRKPQD